MNIIAAIRKFFKKDEIANSTVNSVQNKDDAAIKPQTDKYKNSGESAAEFEFLDGMSTGTAKFIIDREVDPDHLKKYDIKDIENKGRYYLAKIINQDGEVADTVLVDKLNRSIHFQKAKFK